MTNLDYLAAEQAIKLCTVIGLKCNKRKKDGKEDTVDAAQTDTVVNKALGVVSESGPFACGLFLLSRSGTKTVPAELKIEEVIASHALAALVNLAEDTDFGGIQKRWPSGTLKPSNVNADKRALVQHLLEVSKAGLPELLLIQRTWEQVLTYARYIARSQRTKD